VIRLGAVSYLNARPLTWALDRAPARWQIRYDFPSVCSALLKAGEVDLGLVLCRHRFHIEPAFVPHGPDLGAMTRESDAALLIGDPALEADPSAFGLQKIDLGAEWTAMTELPFIYAAWTGRAGAITPPDVRRLQEAQEEGARSTDAIAAEYGRGSAEATARAAAYLRDNVKYGLGPDEITGLQTFLDYAADVKAAPRKRRLEFFGS
jgi:chorismate dehydratase